MALAEVDRIIEIMRNAHLNQQAQVAARQKQEEQDSMAANRLAQQDLEEKRLQQENQHFQASNDLANKIAQAQVAAHKLQSMQTVQQMGQAVQQGAPAPAGSSTVPAISTLPNGEANASPVNPANATSNMLQIPGVEGQIQVATPQAYAQQQAGIKTIEQAPDIAKMQATQEAETKRQVAVTATTQAEETKRQATINAQNQAAAIRLEQERQKGELQRTNIQSGTQLQIAKLPYAIFNNMDPQTRAATVQPSIDALTNGDMSATQVQKEFNEKGMAGAGTAVISTFMGAGGVPPTDAQVKFKQSVQPVVDVLPLIKQYIDMLPKTSTGTKGFITGVTHPDILNPQLDALMKQIDFNIATVAKNLSGDQGQRLQKALLEPAAGGFLPSKFKSTEYNVSNFNKLVDVVNSAIDTQLGSLPKAQRAAIKNSMGLDKIPRLGLDGSPVSLNATPVHKYYDNQGNEVAAPVGR